MPTLLRTLFASANIDPATCGTSWNTCPLRKLADSLGFIPPPASIMTAKRQRIDECVVVLLHEQTSIPVHQLTRFIKVWDHEIANISYHHPVSITGAKLGALKVSIFDKALRAVERQEQLNDQANGT